MRTATIVAVLLVVVFAAAACASGASNDRPQPGANQALSNIAAAPFTELPAPYTVASTTLNDATAAEKLAGSVGTVREALQGGTGNASVDFLVFADASHAAGYARTFSGTLPTGTARKFLPQLPDADCADTNSGGVCGLAAGPTFVETRAAQVDGPDGAGALAAAAATYLAHGGGVVAAAATSDDGSTAHAGGPCAVLTSDEAQSALGGPVNPGRLAGATCTYAGRSGTGASVSIEFVEGGRPKFDFDRTRVQGAQNLTGVGDAAFAFASQAGFVQVYVIKGRTYFVLTLANPADTSRQAHAVALAKKLAGEAP